LRYHCADNPRDFDHKHVFDNRGQDVRRGRKRAAPPFFEDLFRKAETLHDPGYVLDVSGDRKLHRQILRGSTAEGE
jgi:hypothetical protein